MAIQINYQWRITKFNPDFRDDDGYFTLKDEWTCPSEIGKIINGEEFTLEEYLRVESIYIHTVIEFLKESEIKKLRVLQLNKSPISNEEKTFPLYEEVFADIELEEDKAVNWEDIKLICKMVLRNFIGCNLYYNTDFFVHFGWDYYLYIGSNKESTSSILFAQTNGLFVENMKSPYYLTETNIVRSIEWYEKKDGDRLIVGEEIVSGINLDEFRKLLNLSEHHPVIGAFPITEQQAAYIQKYMKHQMLFSNYEYTLYCSD